MTGMIETGRRAPQRRSKTVLRVRGDPGKARGFWAVPAAALDTS